MPAIICLGYNRPLSLQRLLNSLALADYPSPNISLIISLDHCESDKCYRVACDFVWNHGSKEVLLRPARLGLRAHVLACGDLSQKYGSIIMLEDDLIVAQSFYHYALAALDFYSSQNVVAGIALYSHRFNMVAQEPFAPIPTPFSSFFLAFPCSWGQAWTADQWKRFSDWLQANETFELHEDLPASIRKWSKSSWLKLFASFCIETKTTWVYPFHALSTNCGDPGENAGKNGALFQVPLLQGISRTFPFPKFEETPARYDHYFENSSTPLFELDLYGSKPNNGYRHDLLITRRPVKACQQSFGLSLRPWELNIEHQQPGSFFFKAKKDDVLWNSPGTTLLERLFFQLPNRVPVKEWIRLVAHLLRKRIFR